MSHVKSANLSRLVLSFLSLGTTKIKNLDENIGSLRVRLNKDDLNEISEAVPESEVAGNRTYDSMTHATWKYATTPQK